MRHENRFVQTNKVYREAEVVHKGVIILRHPYRVVEMYAQRGIHKLTDEEKNIALSKGILCKEALSLRELPDDTKIYYKSRPGRPLANFNKKWLE